ncbi:MAG: hypothetical protein ACREA1_05695 [Nitrosotalea sp.]
MKSLHISMIGLAIVFFGILFCNVYATCASDPDGILQCTTGSTQLLYSVKTDMPNYENMEKPIITITGMPLAPVHVEIDDSSGNIVFSHDLGNLTNGSINYTLDISSYKPGVYSTTATSPVSKLTTSFTVDLIPTGGPITLNVDKSLYLPGDHVIILGTWISNDLIQLSLINPNGISVESAQTVSDKTGHFSLFNFTIPTNAISGIWQIDATSGVSHSQIQITINSTFHNITYVGINVAKLSPLKQLKSGIAVQNVTCSESLVLVIKTTDGSPACVKDTSVGRLVRQGWWAWNDKVGDTIVNTPDKRDFDSKSCGMSDIVSSIVGTSGFVRDTLPSNGITYSGVNFTGLAGTGAQFAIMPNSIAQIEFTYDFNQYPGTDCKVTSKDVIAATNPAKPDISISDLLSSPDIIVVDKTGIRTDLPLLGDSGDVQVKLVGAEDLNDHVVKVTYQIISKPVSQIGKSYFLSFWWHSAVGITVGNDLYNGTAFSGPRFG